MRVALVHDWLTGMRGGEKPLELLAAKYPEAHLFTLVHVRGRVSPAIERLAPRTSFIQRLPWSRRRYREYLPLFPMAIEWLDLDGYDLVISTSHCAAKSVIAPGARHLCYCFTPMRYAWDQFSEYFGPERLGQLGTRAAAAVMRRLARWDRDTAGRVTRYVAISRHVASRIRRYYNRDAAVVYPPVDIDYFQPRGGAPDPYVLIVSALVPYKRIDLAIEGARLAGVHLKIAGDGPDRTRLATTRGASVEWLGSRTNEELRELYRRAAAVLLPGEEDFGLVPVEAQACGRPVVALARGGALETVVPDTTGVLVQEPSAEAFADGIRRCLAAGFDPAVIRRHAEPFNPERFLNEIDARISETLDAPREARW
jgi:glycosyltransferase involved in cell wall biosynthesis